MKTFNEIKEERLFCEDRIINNAKNMIEKHKDYYPLMTRCEFVKLFGEIEDVNNMVLRRV